MPENSSISVYEIDTSLTALSLAERLANRWRGSHPKVAEHVEEHIKECLACLYFPESHRRRIRTTNGLKRFNQEIKRRTRAVRVFPNREACLRLVTALAVEQSEEQLTGRRYLDMEELSEHRSKKREGKEVALIERQSNLLGDNCRTFGTYLSKPPTTVPVVRIAGVKRRCLCSGGEP